MRNFLSALVVTLGLSTSAHAGATASSEASTSDGESHPAAHAFDGSLTTGWAEGAVGDGTDEWLELTLDKVTEIRSLSLWPGRIDRESRGLREHGRPHTVTVTLSGGAEDLTKTVRVLDIAETGPTRLDVDINGSANKIRIQLDKVYNGGIYSDTWITEVAVNFPTAEHRSLTSQAAWLASKAGERAIEQHSAEVAEAVTEIGEEEFGGKEPFAILSAAAANGPTYLRERAARTVPDGYRVQASPSSLEAMNALLALEDPKAIAALELAATRTTGELAASIRDRVSRFSALADLKGGASRNVLPYGQEGYCKGCFRSFGEPLDIAVDGFGGIWIADIGNHRVQRMDFNGIGELTVGAGEPAISKAWLGATRDWYAAANTPGAGQGAFTLPVSIDVVPNKKSGDGVVVLDAGGGVTVLTGAGKVSASWSIAPSVPLTPGLGGEGHVAVAGKSIVVAWGNEAMVYDLDGTAMGEFEFEDGGPGGLIGLKNGKLAAIFGSDVVMYSTDGFRHGSLLADTLPKGFEYFDITLDEKGKLWAITDTGYAVKYKSPGKVDFQVRLVDHSLGPVRADVYQDLVFLTDRNKVQRFDTREILAASAAQ